tara:strand:+ start:29 stop:1792 length:1764 start_codon:yes stop_codon:yes gene_type:complete
MLNGMISSVVSGIAVDTARDNVVVGSDAAWSAGLAIVDTTPSVTAWQASQSHTGATQTSTSGSGTGFTCSISTNGAGNPTFTVTAVGSGYSAGETIVFTDPGSTSNTATITLEEASTNNIAIGKDALDSTTSLGQGADNNVAIGVNALTALTTGDGNVAIGFDSLDATDDGIYNTGMGYRSLSANCGDENTAIGFQAGLAATGNQGTYVGAQCGDGITGGGGNTAVGFQALSAAADSYNVAMGYKAGNATTGGKNVMIGSAAGEDLIGGSSNVFIGKDAARNITVGIRGVAIGEAALDTATGSGIGYYNVAIGFNVFKTANFTAHNGSIGIGYKAGYYVNPDSGADSTAGNVLIGMYSGMDEGDSQGLTTGLYNTAIGHETLGTNCGSSGNLTGDGNTVMGYRAGYGLKLAAADNTFIGKSAGGAVTEGTQNVLIGSGTVTNAQGDDNSIVIGYGAAGLGSNYAVIGNASITRVYMAAGGDAVMYADGTINTSDMRFKENIKECDLGLDFINKINPVKYNFKEDSNTKYGIIAQEVLKALEDTGIKESSFIATDNPDKLGADYVQFIAPLIKAVQELSQQIEDLKKG